MTALLAKGDDELTLVFIKQALLDEKQEFGKSSSNSEGVAESKGSDIGLKALRFSRSKSGACLNCGQKGYFIETVPFL